MNRVLATVVLATVGLTLVAQEKGSVSDETASARKVEYKADSAVWPAFFAVCDFPNSPDVVGLRLTIPFSSRQESVTGFDLGLWGRSLYFEGLQVNVIRNDVRDACAGIQAGIYNSIGRGDLAGVQVGLWNETGSLRGVQAGLVNTAGTVEGFQVGLINRCETMYGYQVGIVNVIRTAELQFMPILNIGF